jgi:hypothetical protein
MTINLEAPIAPKNPALASGSSAVALTVEARVEVKPKRGKGARGPSSD